MGEALQPNAGGTTGYMTVNLGGIGGLTVNAMLELKATDGYELNIAGWDIFRTCYWRRRSR